MKKSKATRALSVSALIVLAFLAFVAIFVWTSGPRLFEENFETVLPPMNGRAVFLSDDQPVIQPIESPGGLSLEGITVQLGEVSRDVGVLRTVVSLGDTPLTEAQFDLSTLSDGMLLTIPIASQKGFQDQMLTLSLHTEGVLSENPLTLPLADPTDDLSDAYRLPVEDSAEGFVLCYQVSTMTPTRSGLIFPYFIGVVLVLLVAFLAIESISYIRGKSSRTLRFFAALRRYSFLLKQLVMRDFKAKYKRSLLGLLWSFLNPLMTMAVQYVVFSALFRSDIPNFTVYLLSGIVCFTFFNEATNAALNGIVGNAALITKVYVPKYIYPLSRVLSSGINLLLSLIPLFLVILITGTPITWAYVMLPYGIFCLVLFSLGIGLLLSTSMVFFRDTAFLWGIVAMMWMYLTPLFYPITIIPDSFLTVYKLNPLYHLVTFFRTIFLTGLVPHPRDFVICLAYAVGSFGLGSLVFMKNQNKFVLSL